MAGKMPVSNQNKTKTNKRAIMTRLIRQLSRSSTSSSAEETCTTNDNYEFSVHPLLIHHVYENVFSYLAEKEVLQCRLVCKQWHLPATKLYQKIHSPAEFGRRCHELEISTLPKCLWFSTLVAQFNSVMINSQVIPVTKFSLHFRCANVVKEFPQLLSTWNNIIVELYLNIGFWLNDGVAMPSENNISKSKLNLSNLKLLYVYARPRKSVHGDEVKMTKFVSKVMSNAPNLEEVQMNIFSQYTGRPDYTCVIDAMINLLPQSLKKLNLHYGRISNRQIKILISKEMELESFTLVASRSLLTPQTLENFISSQSSSLKELTMPLVFSGDMQEFRQLNLTDMNNVQYLSFPKDRPTISLAAFPNLVTVDFFGIVTKHTSTFWNELFPLGLELPKLQIVKGPRYETEKDAGGIEWIKDISRCCPNIKELFIYVRFQSAKGELRTVFEHLDILKQLHIYLSPLDKNTPLVFDDVFTGIPLVQGKIILNGEFEYDNMKEGSKTNITNLKNLEVLEISRHNGKGIVDSFMSDVTCRLALMNMEKLKAFKTSKCNNISKQCIKDMEEKFAVICSSSAL